MRSLYRVLSLAVLALLSGEARLPAGQINTETKTETQKAQAKASDTAVDETALDERVVREAKLPLDGPGLLIYLRERTYKEPDPKHLAELIQNLGDAHFAVREGAYRELLALGNPVLPALKEAEHDGQEEIRLRAIDLRAKIEDKADPRIQAAVARLIGVRKPAGAVPVLLAYLPFAATEFVADDLCTALCGLCKAADSLDPALTTALTDRLAVKRAAAGTALIASGKPGALTEARKLLNDPDATVRLRINQAFVETARDLESVPRLIDCLKDLPAEKTWMAEDMLLRIAGESAPHVSLGTDAATQKACHAAWLSWWNQHKGQIDLAKADFSKKILGHTLLVTQNVNRVAPGAGIRQNLGVVVSEIDAAKNVRWKFEVPGICVDAQVVGPDRVLVVERNALRVTERDFKGEVKWEKSLQQGAAILSAQRLANGNTFITTQNSLLEFNPKGEQVYSYQRNGFDIFRGRKMRNGDVVFVTQQGLLTRLESKTNTPIKSFSIGILGNVYGNVEELPSGNLLVPLYRAGRVVEYNGDGKEVWSVNARMPTSAMRLPNGNTVVASMVDQRVVEFDRNQREVWTYVADGSVFAARKR